MSDFELHPDLRELEKSLELLDEKERELAFQAESRPIPEGLIVKGLPAGHIALMGDFDGPLKDEAPRDK